MREWDIKASDAPVITLAADARLGATDYANDHIWELRLGGGEPPALTLQTTFGLRARAYRLFPRFQEGDILVTNPDEFAVPPVIRRLSPGYCQAACQPLKDIEVVLDYQVVNSQSVYGRIRVRNTGVVRRQLGVHIAALLSPYAGQRMAPTQLSAAWVLAGQSENLAPVLFMTGETAAVGSPYPALIQKLNISAGAVCEFTWVHTALADIETSFNSVRSLAARAWNAGAARLELLNSGQLEIYTGSPEWDTAFAISQQVAASLLVGPTSQLPAASFVLSRQPHQGYTRRGDGSDYSHSWRGQNAYETLHLAGYLLPGYPEIVQGLVRNMLSTQETDGSVDWQPGLAGQRGLLLATPLLAGLSWQAFTASDDRKFLDEVFSPLRSFLEAWFSPRHDRDADGLPEWDHPLQAGFEEHPVFSPGTTGTRGTSMACTESPGLLALLFHESQALLSIARELDRQDVIPELERRAEQLRSGLESTWDSARQSYSYIDRDTHQVLRGCRLVSRRGSGEIVLNKSFEQPVRLFMRVTTQQGTRPRLAVVKNGIGMSGQHRLERLTDNDFKWYLGYGFYTAERVYSSLETIDIQGLQPEDELEVFAVDLSSLDVSLLLPMWAGMAGKDQAKALVRQHIMDSSTFWSPYGLVTCPNAFTLDNDSSAEGVQLELSDVSTPTPDESSPDQAVSILWNTLAGKGLVACGYRKEAAELVYRLMRAVLQNLRQQGAFYALYHRRTGQGLGEKNSLQGLAPLELFLDALGVHIENPLRVKISGSNPFPWPVTVKYRGLTILRRKNSAVIHFPTGHDVTVKGPSTQLVTVETLEPEN